MFLIIASATDIGWLKAKELRRQRRTALSKPKATFGGLAALEQPNTVGGQALRCDLRASRRWW
jgi:hypothetical protein